MSLTGFESTTSKVLLYYFTSFQACRQYFMERPHCGKPLYLYLHCYWLQRSCSYYYFSCLHKRVFEPLAPLCQNRLKEMLSYISIPVVYIFHREGNIFYIFVFFSFYPIVTANLLPPIRPGFNFDLHLKLHVAAKTRVGSLFFLLRYAFGVITTQGYHYENHFDIFSIVSF